MDMRRTEIVDAVRPTQCTLVPDEPDASTSDHGWNLDKDGDRLVPIIREIKALGVHPSWPLVVNGVAIGRYTADFVYFEGGRQIVEDVKGVVTPEASLRMRVFMALYPSHELRIVDRKGGWERFKQRAVTARAA